MPSSRTPTLSYPPTAPTTHPEEEEKAAGKVWQRVHAHPFNRSGNLKPPAHRTQGQALFWNIFLIAVFTLLWHQKNIPKTLPSNAGFP